MASFIKKSLFHHDFIIKNDKPLSLFIHQTDWFSSWKDILPQELFYATQGSILCRRRDNHHPGDNLVVAKIILLDPRDCEGETQYARFWGREAACKQISQFGKNNSYLGNMIKNNSYPAETHKSNQQLGSKSIFLITLERIVPWRIVKSLLDRPDKDYLLTKVETQAVVTYLEKKVQIKLFMKLALEDIRSNNIMSGPTVCPLIQTMDLR